MRDGQVQTGRIVRVTDRFIALITETPLVCADVELSAVESVKWQPEKGQGNPVLQSLEMGLIMVVLAPAFAVSVIADPFERLSPPLKPLSDSWAARDSKLEFSGNTVKYPEDHQETGALVSGNESPSFGGRGRAGNGDTVPFRLRSALSG